MFQNDTKKILGDIIKGVVLEGKINHLKAARNFLCTGFATNTKITKNFEQQSAIKKEQAKCLTSFIEENSLWLPDVSAKATYLAEGGEAKIYLCDDNRSVIKLNDAICYDNWLNFLNSVSITPQ